MQAAKFLGQGRIDIVDRPTPKPGPGQVLIRVSHCGLCGSDRRPYENGWKSIPGHEVSGTVVDSNGTGVAEGTRAAIYLPIYCGECRYCKAGATNNCINRKTLIGWSPEWNGGYAEYITVPARNVLAIDPKLGLADAVLLLDMIGTSFHSLRISGVKEARRGLVMGCGPLGLGVVAGMKAFGVPEIFASEVSDYRRKAAEDLGATAVTPDEVAGLKDIDLIVEAAGKQNTIMQAIRLILPQGRVVMLGESRVDWTFETGPATFLKDYNLIRSWYFPITEVEENQQMLLDGRVDAAKLVSHAYPLSRLEEAFRTFFEGSTRKVLIEA